jgi:putative redox protein
VADLTVALQWTTEQLSFRGGKVGGPQVVVDGDGEAGPSPVTALLLALGGCMAADVVMILTKMKLPLTDLELVVEGDRRAEPPRRVTAVRLKYVARGLAAADESKVWRAIELSRDTYCSVLHSLREDIELRIDLELA